MSDSKTLLTGVLERWEDEKGYGFIQPDEGGREIFAHIHDFTEKYPRPRDGDQVGYREGTDEQGRPCAKHIIRPQLQKRKRPSRFLPLLLILAYLGWFAWKSRQGAYPEAFPLYLAGISFLSYLHYAWDKRRAIRKKFRISEARLHLLDLLGGWPGGLLAQRTFRHKVSKTSFQVVFWFTALLNIGILLYLATRPGYWKNGSFEEYIPALFNRIQQHLTRLQQLLTR